MICEIGNCRTVAKFEIFDIEHNAWKFVCGKHNSSIGCKNLVRCGLTYKEAFKVDAEVLRQERANKGQKSYKFSQNTG